MNWARSVSGSAAVGASMPSRMALGWPRLVTGRVSGFALIVVLLILWEASVGLRWIVSENWPPFSSVMGSFKTGWLSGEFFKVVGSTLYRTLIGFAAGSAIGIASGIVLGRVAWLDWMMRPLIEVERTLPLPAVLPPLILLLGVDDLLKVVVIALAVFPPVFVNTYAGVRSVDETLALTARTFGISASATMRKIILPASAPAIAAGMRTALALALSVCVISEMISGQDGVGFYILTMQYALRADAMYAAILSIAIVGYLINRLFVVLELRALHWHAPAQG